MHKAFQGLLSPQPPRSAGTDTAPWVTAHPHALRPRAAWSRLTASQGDHAAEGNMLLLKSFQKLDRKTPRVQPFIWANPSKSSMSACSGICAFSSVLQVEKERKIGVNSAHLSPLV